MVIEPKNDKLTDKESKKPKMDLKTHLLFVGLSKDQLWKIKIISLRSNFQFF